MVGLIRDGGGLYLLDIQAIFPPEVNGVWMVYFWGSKYRTSVGDFGCLGIRCPLKFTPPKV